MTLSKHVDMAVKVHNWCNKAVHFKLSYIFCIKIMFISLNIAGVRSTKRHKSATKLNVQLKDIRVQQN
uniref:Uncharacterized protein n=1 Tax=Arundo donax TaxID=35708 RepID=A0A0A9H4N5_ARUDO